MEDWQKGDERKEQKHKKECIKRKQKDKWKKKGDVKKDKTKIEERKQQLGNENKKKCFEKYICGIEIHKTVN